MKRTQQTLLKKLSACRHCAERFRATATAHAPNPIFQLSKTARLGVAGQAPGLRAHEASKPFADPSGDRLRSWMGIDETVFYDASRIAILPMAFCFPGYDAKGSDLPPPRDCARLWRAPLFAEFTQLETLLLVGKSSIGWHLPALKSLKLDEIVRGGAVSKGKKTFIPLPHPSWRNNAWLKRNAWFESEILPELRREVAHLL